MPEMIITPPAQTTTILGDSALVDICTSATDELHACKAHISQEQSKPPLGL